MKYALYLAWPCDWFRPIEYRRYDIIGLLRLAFWKEKGHVEHTHILPPQRPPRPTSRYPANLPDGSQAITDHAALVEAPKDYSCMSDPRWDKQKNSPAEPGPNC